MIWLYEERMIYLRDRLLVSRARVAAAQRADGQSGFTLIELLVVLAILGMIVAFVTPQVLKYLGRAKTDAAHIQIENIAGALDLYRLDVGRYPTQAEGLSALVERPVGLDAWNGPYLKQKSVPPDPWSRPYIYKIPGDHGEYDLYTLGADGVPGGTGENQDVTNW
jgi:general secretion pathway protein G